MKSKFVMGALAAATFSGTAMGSAQYPFLAPKCSATISVPSNSAGAFFSEDCKTAFVLPDLIGTAKIKLGNTTGNLMLCAGVKSLINTDNKLSAQIEKLAQSLDTLPIGPKRDAVRKEIQAIKDMKSTLYDTYDNIVGGYAQVTFQLPAEQDRIHNFVAENAYFLIEKGVHVQSAPISRSLLTFPSHPLGPQFKMRSVLAHSIPGVTQPNQDGVSELSTTQMNGAISGSLTLSVMGLCPKVWDPTWDPQSLAVNLTPNLTYEVPVQSVAGYKAELNSRTAIHNLSSAWQQKSQFTVKDISKHVVTGSAGDAFTFNVTNYELTDVYSDEAKADFFMTLRDAVLQRLSSRLASQMTLAGFLELEEAAPDAVAPPPGFIDEVHSGGSCSSHGPFGLFGSSCSNYSYIVKIPRDSSAEVIAQKIADTNFVNTEEVQVRQTIHRIYTSTFVGQN